MRIFQLNLDTYGILEDEVDPSVCEVTGVTQIGVISIYHDHKHDGSGCDNLQIDHPVFGSLDLEFTRSCTITEVLD